MPVQFRVRTCHPSSSEYAFSANLAGFVLCDFVLGVLLAVLALAISAPGLGNVDLERGEISPAVQKSS